MASSSSIAAGPPETGSANISQETTPPPSTSVISTSASLCSSCFDWFSSFIPWCLPQSDSSASTSTAGLIPDEEASTSIASGSTSTTGSKGAFHGVAPSASTCASERTHKPCYDVFINHRGPDVKYTLASVLYGILTGMSLSVFLDSQELEYGDFLPRTIEVAMASALLHIAIFSERYAESPWCLAELSFMLKSGATIIPVFYHVDPSDLRWVDQGKGKYVQAFKEHERKDRYKSEQLQEWKRALHIVSFYNGQIIKTSEDEMRLLKNIVSCVLKKLNNNVPLEVAKHPVGMKEIVEDFKVNTVLSDQGNQDVRIVGIWGMGGSGKTTLAKELYNEIFSSMERSSFVFDVRDAATKGLLHEKQKKLLNDLGIQGLAFDNIEEGKRSLSMGLRYVRVLIVLDDVDNMEQLDALLPTIDSLQKGSLVIVTTRIRDVLKFWGISIYKMRSLDPLYAKQLFCWHAFLKSSPPDEFKELVEKFLEVCNGLPLSLKVFGAQLYGESRKEYWESQLHKISRILPDDIKQRLKISYDTLDDEEKEMFLDIACFFIRTESSLAIDVWNGLGWSGLQSWERLLNRCLVELDNYKYIRMHDHLRDLGRDIANKQSPYRLWFPQQIINVQKQKQERIGIQGIIATSSQNFWVQNGIELLVNTNGGIWSLRPSLVGLKYLVTSGDYFNNQIISEVSRELVWIRWFQYKQAKLPSGLSLKKLRVLEFYDAFYIEELWGEMDGKAPVQLRRLTISACHNLKGLPKSIGHLVHLKEIVIAHGYKVRSLPDEICLLQSLESLVLNFCSELSSLPSNFGNLSNLRHLSLVSCSELETSPVSFKNLMLLEYLNLEHCKRLTFSLEEDLNFLENTTKLEYLNLSKCSQLEQLPRHITNKASLRELDFSETSLRELPDNIGELSRLTKMRIVDVLLTCLPASLGDLSSLTSLEICDCPNLESLPDSLGDLSSLTNLKISLCPKLEREGVKSLPKSIRQLNNLQKLRIYNCPISELDFELSNLKEIDLHATEECRVSFPGDCLPHLESLSVSNNHQLEVIEALPRTLQSIYLTDCEMLKSIPSFSGFTSLREFYVRGCYGIQKIEGLKNCTRLQTLTAETCWEMPGIESLEQMQNLKWLQLKANKGSVIERCIQRIQKWPDEIMICARAVPDAASLVHSLLSPSLMILDSISNQNIKPYGGLDLELKSPFSGSAFMFCFVINCFSSQMEVTGMFISRSRSIHPWEYSVKVEKGKWALVGAFTQHSRYFTEDVKTAEKFRIGCFGNKAKEEFGEVEKGLVVSGEEEQTPLEVVHSLLRLFLQS